MKTESRVMVYDDDLHIEAYRFDGVAQPFPNHFHDYYVIGLVESGQRVLSCKSQEYAISSGDTILFNPGDNHACVQSGGDTLNYRAFNICKEVMSALTREVARTLDLPQFTPSVIYDHEVICYLHTLHDLVMAESREFVKEETLLLAISLLIQKYAQPFDSCIPECREEIEGICQFMEERYAEHISLDAMCDCVGLSKSTLLRAFTRSKGVTPYRYLENIRIGEAKKLLEQGVSPVEAALQTGFCDQSHFTNYFTRFIGLTPGVYRDTFRKGKAGAHEE